ncbi:cecropin-A1-like [Anopheles aquasalis]|uniref:cecropin-A1-like n=1 Tax=Anopheles aquasalis TaxID=42839 RepID=UPI00215B38C5|nr:cecropin-A1-like [Anopheles aquasalis]
MNLTKLFVVVLLAMAVLFGGQVEAGRLKNFGKKLEKVGQRVFKATEKVVPVLLGIKQLGKKDDGH